MKLSQDILIDRAFELYLTYGYSGVSVSVLKEKLGMGRASLYYYFENKDDLFKAVVNHYFFDVTRKSLEMPDNVTLKQMIDTRVATLDHIKQAIKSKNENLTMSNLASLLLVSISIFPECLEQARQIKKISLDVWKRAISNSMELGEIRKDLDIEVLSMMFSNVKDAHETFAHILPTSDTFSEQAYLLLYNLIKL